MPTLYLSPSTQEFNDTVLGVSEEYLMNILADAMEPYLTASGISFTRNNPDESLSAAINASNQGGYDFHLALHSNAAPENLVGILAGPDVYYYVYSESGEVAAEIFANNLKAIYPNPDLVTAIPTTSLAELRNTAATSLLIEIAYHDNLSDAEWIVDNINTIAENLVLSLTEYFGIPFVNPYLRQ